MPLSAVKPSPFESCRRATALSMYSAKSLGKGKKPKSPKVKETFFGKCERDDEGRCLPKGGSGEEKKKKNDSSSGQEIKKVAKEKPTAGSIVEAANVKYPLAGKLVDGYEVLKNIPNLSSIDSSLTGPYWTLPGIREIDLKDFTGLTGKSYSVEETERIADLASKIQQSGKIAPLIVVDDGHPDGPYILEGSHRVEALYKLGAKSFPALLVIDLGDIGKKIKNGEDIPERLMTFSQHSKDHQKTKAFPTYPTKDLKPHKLGCLMAILPEALRKSITDWTLENVPDFHLSPEGREHSPHITCFLPGQELQGQVIRGSKVRYSGEAIKLTTASGKTLSITPNHPILTTMGFAPAGQLHKGQCLLNHVGKNETRTINNKQDTPAMIEEVFKSLSIMSGVSTFLTQDVSVFDFHGDAKFFHGDVSIVGSNGQLRSDVIPQTTKGLRQREFRRGSLSQVPLATSCCSDLLLKSMFFTSKGFFTRDGIRLPFCRSHSSKSSFRFYRFLLSAFRSFCRICKGCTIVPELEASFSKSCVDDCSTNARFRSKLACRFPSPIFASKPIQHRFGDYDSNSFATKPDPVFYEASSNFLFLQTELPGKLFNRYPGEILTDQIVRIERFHYEGPVYDFESPQGYIIVNQLYVSNCKYGFVDSGPETVQSLKALLTRFGPIPIRLKTLSLFKGGEDGDVLKVDVESPKLRELNAVISSSFPCEDKFPEYLPHLTLAYLDPLTSSSYEGLPAPFLDSSFILDKAEWSGADGNRETIPLSFLPVFSVDRKALSYLSDSSGGTLVPPPRQGKPIPIKRHSLFGGKALNPPQIKQGTCKTGQTAAQTGCTPAEGESAQNPAQALPTAPRKKAPFEHQEEAANKHLKNMRAILARMRKNEYHPDDVIDDVPKYEDQAKQAVNAAWKGYMHRLRDKAIAEHGEEVTYSEAWQEVKQATQEAVDGAIQYIEYMGVIVKDLAESYKGKDEETPKVSTAVLNELATLHDDMVHDGYQSLHKVADAYDKVTGRSTKNKSLKGFDWLENDRRIAIKALEKGTCKTGERADLTGCTPQGESNQIASDRDWTKSPPKTRTEINQFESVVHGRTEQRPDSPVFHEPTRLKVEASASEIIANLATVQTRQSGHTDPQAVETAFYPKWGGSWIGTEDGRVSLSVYPHTFKDGRKGVALDNNVATSKTRYLIPAGATDEVITEKLRKILRVRTQKTKLSQVNPQEAPSLSPMSREDRKKEVLEKYPFLKGRDIGRLAPAGINNPDPGDLTREEESVIEKDAKVVKEEAFKDARNDPMRVRIEENPFWGIVEGERRFNAEVLAGDAEDPTGADWVANEHFDDPAKAERWLEKQKKWWGDKRHLGEYPDRPESPKVKPSPFEKSLNGYLTKSEGTCKQGERADLTDCVPADGSGHSHKEEPQKPEDKAPTRQGSVHQAAVELGSSTIKLAKAAGHWEHIAKEWATDHVGKAVSKLPPKSQKIVAGAWLGIRYGTKAAFATYTAGQALAEKVAKANGASPEEAQRIRAICSTIDVVSYKVVMVGVESIAGLGVAGAVSFVPVGSAGYIIGGLTYLAYSKAKDPLKMLEAAKSSVKAVARKMGLSKSLDGQELIEEAYKWVHEKGEGRADWRLAFFLSALDEAGDLPGALRIVEESFPKK